jgi:hypothetical protein
MTVDGVAVGEERLAKPLRLTDGSESFRERRTILQGLELGSRELLVPLRVVQS